MIHSTDKIWDIQANIKGRNDFAFFVTNDEKYGVYFSRFDEYGMLKFVSSIQVWNNKEKPRLLFQSRQIKFEYQYSESCFYLDKSDLLVLLTPCIHKEHYDLLYILFDFNKNIFAIINAPNFRLVEVDRNIIRLNKNFRYIYDDKTERQIANDDEKQIDLTKIQWQDMNNIDKACSFFIKNNR